MLYHYYSIVYTAQVMLILLPLLLARCSRKHLCTRHAQPNHWLWSFEQTNQCVTVQSLQPSNQSRDQQTQVGPWEKKDCRLCAGDFPISQLKQEGDD